MERTIAVGVLCIAVGGVLAQWLAWRFRLPAIVLLFAAGLLFGPGLQWLHPAQQFGPALRPLVGLSVAVVVFEGGLALDIRELRAAGGGVLRLSALALPLNLILASVAAYLIAGMSGGPRHCLAPSPSSPARPWCCRCWATRGWSAGRRRS